MTAAGKMIIVFCLIRICGSSSSPSENSQSGLHLDLSESVCCKEGQCPREGGQRLFFHLDQSLSLLFVSELGIVLHLDSFPEQRQAHDVHKPRRTKVSRLQTDPLESALNTCLLQSIP